MFLRILAFLLETVFFVLIGAALLRAWMNWTRVSMRDQPGIFVMALTDWLVKPLRRTLPKAVTSSRIDWASVITAAVFALVYGLIWMALSGLGSFLGPLAWMSLLLFVLKMLLRVALQTLLIMVFGFAILSWIQPGSPAYSLLGRLTEPLISPLRRVIPSIGGVDLSALVLILILQICLMVLG